MNMESVPTVFVLDDDRAVQDSLQALLRVMKLPAEIFSTVSEFEQAYDPTRRGCLLLDLRLPGDGYALLKRLASKGGRLPVIVITGHGDAETRDRVMRLGATAFFEKPFHVPQLCDVLRDALRMSAEEP